MTRKDYIKIAAALQGAYPIPENNTPLSTWRGTVDAITAVLAADNPRFDKNRFLEACCGAQS